MGRLVQAATAGIRSYARYLGRALQAFPFVAGDADLAEDAGEGRGADVALMRIGDDRAVGAAPPDLVFTTGIGAGEAEFLECRDEVTSFDWPKGGIRRRPGF